MRLLIFGPQGAGKGTQGKRIAEKYSVPAISTGDIFRWAIAHDLDLGRRAKEYVEAGHLVPDDITLGAIRERLEADDVKPGFLLDGFPRNLVQAQALDELLDLVGTKLDAVVWLEVPDEVSLRRITGRRVCPNCGRNYHVDSPPSENWTCDTCGGKVVARGDDNEVATVRRRLDLYHDETEPLKGYYEDKGLLRHIDGDASPDEVFARIVAAL